MSIWNFGLALFAAIGVAACGDDGSSGDEVLGGSLTITGDVVDFQSRAAVGTSASVNAAGLTPAPQIATQGAAFSLTGVPENSTFQILANAPPSHRATYSQITVTTSDTDVDAPVVSEAFLTSLTTGFGVTATAAKGVLILRIVDANGQPRAGVAASNLSIGGNGAIGPRFLDANLAPQQNATATSASGYVVFFEVPTGVVSMTQTAGASVTLDMPTSPIAAGIVTVADVRFSDDDLVLPTNVSFSRDIVPIFSRRGCVACHSGGGIGKDLGGLQLDTGANKVYRELVEERPNIRVNLATPEQSLVLRYPSREDPPDRHPNVTFTGPADLDYMALLAWIREGAANN